MKTRRRTEELQGEDVRRVFESILPDDALDVLIREGGMQQRKRPDGLDAKLFLRSMVIAAATGAGGRQADNLRMYVQGGGSQVSRAAHYCWYDTALERTMELVRGRAFAYAAALPRDLPHFLKGLVHDVHAFDSMTVRLPIELMETYPGAGNYAALKVHKRYSVGIGTTVDYSLSPARDHDSRHLTVDESYRGLALLVDLGYASRKFINDCNAHGALFVIRLKENWRPKVDRIVSGEVVGGFVAGTDFDLLLDKGRLAPTERKPIDADVTVGRGGDKVSCRLVAIAQNGKYFYYLTNMPRSVKPKQVTDLYRVRWEIELDNKLDKSCMNLDDIGAKKPEVVRALVHASLVASMIVCFLAHHHRLREGHAPRARPERTRPPVHPQALGKMLAFMAMRIATAMQMPRDQAAAEWDFMASVLVHMGSDPNWRRSPSILDQIRGWETTPGTPRKGRAESIDHPIGPIRPRRAAAVAVK